MMCSSRSIETLESRLVWPFEFSAAACSCSGMWLRTEIMGRPPFSQVTGGRAFQEAVGRCVLIVRLYSLAPVEVEASE